MNWFYTLLLLWLKYSKQITWLLHQTHIFCYSVLCGSFCTHILQLFSHFILILYSLSIIFHSIVTMLLQQRAVVALGFRMCSTHVTKGPLMDTARPSSGKMKIVSFVVCWCVFELWISARQVIFSENKVLTTYKWRKIIQFLNYWMKNYVTDHSLNQSCLILLKQSLRLQQTFIFIID